MSFAVLPTIPGMSMLDFHAQNAKCGRQLMSWIMTLLMVVLLVGVGSDLHGQDCTCDHGSSQICQVCELQHPDSALTLPLLSIDATLKIQPAYLAAEPLDLLITDLEQDHPPPEGAAQG